MMGAAARSFFNKNVITFLLLMAGYSFVQGAVVGVRNLSAASDKVREEIKDVKGKLSAARELILVERTNLRKEMLRTEKELNELKVALSWLKERKESLNADLKTNDIRLLNLTGESRRVFEILRENRKELESFVGRVEPLKDIFNRVDDLFLSDNSGTKEEVIRTLLFDIYMKFFVSVSRICQVRRDVVLPDGSKELGDLLLCSAFGGMFWGERGSAGIVYLPPGAESYHVEKKGASFIDPDNVENAFSGKSETVDVPCDISGGIALARLGRERTLIQFLKAGGIIMIPIGIIALLALFMIIERVIFLARVDTRIDSLLDSVIPYVKKREFDAAITTAKSTDGPVGRIILAGIKGARDAPGRLEETMENAILYEMQGLERFRSTISVFAAISPLLGLLGTVSGMIKTFQVITVYGTGHSRLLSGGISEALITTEVGLAVAVPILLAYSWLSGRVKNILGHMDRAAISFAGSIDKKDEAENVS